MDLGGPREKRDDEKARSWVRRPEPDASDASDASDVNDIRSEPGNTRLS